MPIKISINNFGGNKDNYFNFRQCHEYAVKQINISRHYVCPEIKDNDLNELDKFIKQLRDMAEQIEFED